MQLEATGQDRVILQAALDQAFALGIESSIERSAMAEKADPTPEAEILHLSEIERRDRAIEARSIRLLDERT